MAITFDKVPQATFNIETGKTTGIAQPKPPAKVGMPTEELHNQALDLIKKKVPLEKALLAIEKHPDITDKATAKSMVAAVYQIMGSK